jgi:hypothetical protein
MTNQVRLWDGALWRLHSSHRRLCYSLLRYADFQRRREKDHDD